MTMTTQKMITLGSTLRAKYTEHAHYFDMATGAISNCIMMTMMKILIDNNNIPTTVVVFVRMLVTTLVTALCLILTNDRNVLHAFISSPEFRPWLALRGLFGTASFWLLYRSLKFLPVEDQQAIWYTCPILTGAIACVWPGDKWRPVEIACGAICLIGMLVVVQPGGTIHSEVAGDRTYGCLFAFFGTFFGAMVFIIIRNMGKEVKVMTSLFHFGWICTSAMGITMLAVPEQRLSVDSLSPVVVSMLLGVAFTGTAAAFLMNRAVQVRRPGRVTLIMYIQVPFLLVSDYLVFAHHPDVLSLIGSGVIITAATLLTSSKDVDQVDDESESQQEENQVIYQALPMTSISETNLERQIIRRTDSPSSSRAGVLIDSGSF